MFIMVVCILSCCRDRKRLVLPLYKKVHIPVNSWLLLTKREGIDDGRNVRDQLEGDKEAIY